MKNKGALSVRQMSNEGAKINSKKFNLDSAVDRYYLSPGNDIPDQLIDSIFTHRVNSLTLREWVKIFSAPSCAVVLVKGIAIAINGERRFAWQTEISRRSIFNCGF